jgi:dihydrofolate reductase
MHGTIIVATDENGLIGRRPDPSLPGETPWQGQLPIDMKYFQDQTLNRSVLLARPTYMSIPEKFRPLINRTNLIWTRQKNLFEEGACTVNSLNEAFECSPGEELMICGGGQLYATAMEDPRVDMILRTRVLCSFQGNIHFPEIDENEWVRIDAEHHAAEGKNLYGCTFETYVRRSAMIVDPRNGRGSDYQKELLAIQRSRLCPFCPGGKTLTAGTDPVIAENDKWVAINSHTPIENTAFHWVIFPKRHMTELKEITGDDWEAYLEIVELLKKRHGVIGGAPNIREGDTEITGATVRHLHFNYIVPFKGIAVCVYFGQMRSQT